MNTQITAQAPIAHASRPTLNRLWRSWWLRAAKAQQRRCLERVLTDPHLARDLGLPVNERPILRTDLW
ncbi:hypothetical protein [Gymnodinialimonas hymeniacidonis]|uniref:hypothetical protein n=1 Tax=Gymnodinialimonas hymeniacidonis TaxID=3126508 RepID=UPI0034C631F6